VYLIVGLGNPGVAYKQTRHNIGFKVIDLWSRELGVRLSSRRFGSRNCLTVFQKQRVILFRPMTFMNGSGRAVKSCADFYKLESRNILVVHDDLDLPVGRIKAAKDGGAGGHKGVESIIDRLGSTDFRRLRIGIGRPRYGELIETFVLKPFYEGEKDIIKKAIKIAVHGCELFVTEGIESTMNFVNRKDVSTT
jgi:PTH1 family peptidyl-tRNA hydrolase